MAEAWHCLNPLVVMLAAAQAYALSSYKAASVVAHAERCMEGRLPQVGIIERGGAHSGRSTC